MLWKKKKNLEQDMCPESSEWWKGVGFKKGFSIGLVGKVAFEQSLAKLMSGESVQVEETASPNHRGLKYVTHDRVGRGPQGSGHTADTLSSNQKPSPYRIPS